jgi:hypothetical protein
MIQRTNSSASARSPYASGLRGAPTAPLTPLSIGTQMLAANAPDSTSRKTALVATAWLFIHALSATLRRSHIGKRSTRPGTEAITDRTAGSICSVRATFWSNQIWTNPVRAAASTTSYCRTATSRPDMSDTAEAKASRDAAYKRITHILGVLRMQGRFGWDMVLDLTRSGEPTIRHLRLVRQCANAIRRIAGLVSPTTRS